MPTIVKMPKWGLTMTSGTVTGWSRLEGDPVTEGAPLLTVETEKAVDDVEAPATGVLRKIVAETGSEVPVSGPVAIITAPDEQLSDDELAAFLATLAVGAASATGDTAPRAARAARQASRDSTGRVNASPAARKRAGELGIDLETVEATGPGGRVTSDDVDRAAAALETAAAAPRAEMVELDDGFKVYALVAGPVAAPETIVFMHGLGGAQSTWANVLGEFAGDYRVAAIDLPGHGASDKPTAEQAYRSIPELANAVAQIVEKLELAPAVLVGHSLGGAIALHLALERPKLVRAIALIDSAGLGQEISGELLDRVESEPSREEARLLLELFFADRRFVLERGIDDMHASRTAPGADAAVKAIAADAFSRDGQRMVFLERLPELDIPVLLVWGETDRVIPVSHAIAAAEVMPTAWLEVMPDIAHVPQVEASAAFATVVNRWLTSFPRP